MIKLIIIADDLTGALDTGVQFSKEGIKTLITTDLNLDLKALDEEAQVVVFDTESRHINMSLAYSLVSTLVEMGLSLGVEFFYKKTDSTLRGHIGSELSAILDITCDNLMFIPAFPSNKRTTKDGKVYVNDTLLHKTDFAKDPLNPIKSSSIKSIIREESKGSITLVKANTLIDIEKEGIYVFDAETEEDLFSIGEYLKSKDKLKFTSGSAGFARVLSKIIDFKRTPTKMPCFKGSTLIINGSVNSQSLKQVSYAKELGYGSINISPEELFKRDFIRAIKEYKAFDEEKPFIINTITEREGIIEYYSYGEKINLSKVEISKVISENLGILTKDLLREKKTANLVVFGGDTAIEILNNLNIKGIYALGEILTGVAIASLGEVMFITKAGGFGDTNLLELIIAHIKGRL
ncbi:MAG TPA: four-carbon acid sugar kinase family protein [Clostridiaceae bacterium]